MESKKNKRARLARVLDRMRAHDPAPRPGLDYRDPWQLVVATVLSAQCTDQRVNMVTPGLFARWPTPEAMSGAPLGELEEEIRSIGLFRNKAKSLSALARRVVEVYGGEVPASREGLESLPGVGRKTASVVLAQGFGVPAFAVDTHVGRVSNRLGFVSSPDPVKVERAMTALVDADHWGEAHLLLILHGRRVCKARKPLCRECPVRDLCPYPEAADA